MRLLGVVLSFVVVWFVLLTVMGAIGGFGTADVLLLAVFAAVITSALSRYYNGRRT